MAYFLQTQAHRPINDRNYDIKDYHESDPRTKYESKTPKFYKESKQTTYSLVQKLKDVINILRDVTPAKGKPGELDGVYESYFAFMRHKAPPNTKEETRIPQIH